MWCKSCQQDVPAVAAADDASRVCCPRCTSTLSPVAATRASTSSSSTGDSHETESDQSEGNLAPVVGSFAGDTKGPPPLLLNLDDWRLEDDVRTVRRVLQSVDGKPHLRFDAAHDEVAKDNAREPHFSRAHAHQAHAARSNRHTDQHPTNRDRPAGKSSWFSWLLMSMGLMTFVCGAVLLGWYFQDGQEHLWRFGLPLTLGGQVVLLFGLLVQLEALWQNNRGTSKTLDELDQQFDELRQTATAMSNNNSGAAKSFYVHMAEDASPDVLLADLKGQLDVLAVKLAKQR